MKFELYEYNVTPNIEERDVLNVTFVDNVIKYNDSMINDESKVSAIINLINEHREDITELKNSNPEVYKGGRQQKLTVQFDGEVYEVIGNTSLLDSERLYNFLKNEIMNIVLGNVNSESIFTNYVNLNSQEIKETIRKKLDLLNNKLNGNIDESEMENKGYLLWNCKMILRNIYMLCDKLIAKFIEELSDDEINYYKGISSEIKNNSDKMISIEGIRNIYNAIK